MLFPFFEKGRNGWVVRCYHWTLKTEIFINRQIYPGEHTCKTVVYICLSVNIVHSISCHWGRTTGGSGHILCQFFSFFKDPRRDCKKSPIFIWNFKSLRQTLKFIHSHEYICMCTCSYWDWVPLYELC